MTERPAVYCDQLTWSAGMRLAIDRVAGRMPGAEVWLLDGPPVSLRARLAAALLKACGVRWREASFFAGHLRTPSGEAVRPSARKLAFQMAFAAAAGLVAGSALLARFNNEWGRNTLTLFLARRLWPPAERIALRALTVQALTRAAGTRGRLILTWPLELPRHVSTHLPPDVPVAVGAVDHGGWCTGRLSGLLWLVRSAVQSLVNRGGGAKAAEGPAVLLLQEDDISLDHSYRSQPHWLRDNQPPPPFRTLILRAGPGEVKASSGELARMGIEMLDAASVSVWSWRHADGRRLLRKAWHLAVHGLFDPRGAASRAKSEAARLAGAAGAIAGLVQHHSIRAFLTCENYMLHADATQVVATALGVRTLSYQYSSLPYPSLALLTTADTMALFSPSYRDRWTWRGIEIPNFIGAGYPYDASFALVKPRALARRARLHNAGAAFIIGVFDESVQADRYGLVHVDEYEAQLMMMLTRVIEDPSLGLIFKTQFRHNLARRSAPLQRALAAAQATGRLELPDHGNHRNVVLPAEVAQAADITIGHAIGGTASLEAALAGCRSVIVNSYGFVTGMDAVYAQADIMLPSLPSALAAIADHRRGERPRLGDWGAILPLFDPYRDGRAADRLRALVTEAVGGNS